MAMIAQAVETPGWQRELADAVRSVDELLALLGLDASALGPPAAAREAVRQFPLRVPRGFVARMRPGDAHDPLLRQVLPVAAEAAAAPGFVADPLHETSGDAGLSATPGLLRKYRGRALLLATAACGVHCRYCFRRHFPYGEHRLDPPAIDRALAELAADPTVEEVILSGGDPLALPDPALAALAARLAAIPHLRRLRVHSRQPIVLPSRVDDALLGWLTGSRLAPLLVVHVNHPAELDREVSRALAALRGAGVPLLNQSVLLRGVNDSSATLRALSEALFEGGVLPYYLHLLDPVAGAAHFEVPEDEARRLVAALRAELPGYLVPRLVREQPGAPAKVLVAG
jgi:EF-P beta-lysylation protein EpmB